jgi:XTP/dITP diphosphohydrolase
MQLAGEKGLLFGSFNEAKVSEVRRIAAPLGYTIRSLGDLEHTCKPPEAAEVGMTYEQNALIKGLAYARRSAEPVLVDDTGLEVDALGGLPGVYTKGFGLHRLLQVLAPGIKYRAQFVCCMAVVYPSGRSILVRGVCSGHFIPDLHSGTPLVAELPYSSYFVPHGEVQSLSLLTRERHDFPSHRVGALTTLLKVF